MILSQNDSVMIVSRPETGRDEVQNNYNRASESELKVGFLETQTNIRVSIDDTSRV